MAGELTYAKVGGPPDDWFGLTIIDLDTNAGVFGVVEVNTAEGWLVRHKRGTDGMIETAGDSVVHERIVGRFKIVRPT